MRRLRKRTRKRTRTKKKRHSKRSPKVIDTLRYTPEGNPGETRTQRK